MHPLLFRPAVPFNLNFSGESTHQGAKGAWVGAAVGALVGAFVGALVGATVGALVGAGVEATGALVLREEGTALGA